MNTIIKIIASAAIFIISANTISAYTSENRKESLSLEECRQGISWENGQAFPRMAAPADMLDALDISSEDMPVTEKTVFSSLQGLINKTKPRIILFDVEREGKTKWPKLLDLTFKQTSFQNRWELVKKYSGEIRGLVRYSIEKSEHYINVASSIAGLLNALPVTDREFEIIKNYGLDLPVLADLTELEYERPSEIYQYFYDTWWESCTKRLLISQNPRHGYIRDLGIAAEAAIIWLDPRIHSENTVLRKFLRDMESGQSIIAGWWADERSGIGIGTEYGISTVPADFYENATVYSGMNHTINIPPIPRMPKLENKIYIAVFLSDGDNIQYCQHAMSMLWDNPERGIIPINWTVSPALADLGPGLLNYYYASASDMDCLVCGPSGLGYALIYDAHNRVWNTDTKKDIDPYTELTGRYLERSGLRIITIWDELNEEQMNSYAENCRYLYGITEEDWEFHAPVNTVEVDGRLAFMPNRPCYASDINKIYEAWKDTVKTFDSTHPIFLAAQGESWKMGPDQMVDLKSMLEELAPGKVEICRGDHFFMLYNQSRGLSFNLALLPDARIESSSDNSENAADGSPATLWTDKDGKSGYITMDFGKEYIIDRYVLRHASASGRNADADIRSFSIETSMDAENWTRIDRQIVDGQVTDIDIPETSARYVKFTVDSPADDGIARIGDIEIFGRDPESMK